LRTLWLGCLLGLLACGTPRGPQIPTKATAAFVQGQQLEAAGKTAQARAQFESALALAAEYPDAQLALLSVIRKQSGDEAARRYAEAVAAEPATQPEGLLLLAMLETDPERKIRQLEAALDARPSLYQALFELGLAHRSRDRFERALGFFDRVIAQQPRHLEAHVQASYCQFRLFRWRLTLHHATRALAIDARALRPRIFLTVDRLIKRDFEGAIRHIRLLRKQHPDHHWSGEERSTFLLAFEGALAKQRIARKTESGLTLAKEAVAIFPTASLTHDYLGYFHELSGKLTLAHQHYLRSSVLDPYRLQTVQDLRRSFIRSGRYKEALRVWRRATPLSLVRRPHNGMTYSSFLLTAALRDTQPNNPYQMKFLGQRLADEGWLDEAIIVLEQAGASEEQARVAGVRSFIRALRLELRAHYRKLERGHSSLDLDDLRTWILEHWPTRPAPDLALDLNRWFGYVEEADPFAVRAGSLAAALSQYNLVFDVGDNNGYLDFRLMRLLYRKRLNQRVGRLPYAYTVLLTDETLIDNYLGYLSGHPRISGRAFLSRQGFYVAVDTLRPSKHGLISFLSKPPATPTTDELGYDAELDAALRKRFLARFGIDYPQTQPDARSLDAAFAACLQGYIHNVWLHELGHLVDFERFVPLSHNLSTNVWLALRSGLSPARIELRFEQTAETFSLATTRYPFLSLQDNLARLRLNPDSLFYMVLVAWQKKDPKDSPYYKGAQHILQAIIDGSAADSTAALATKEGALIRKLARKLCIDEGIAFEED